jgi:DNA-binding NarL/FixJ family response regulator
MTTRLFDLVCAPYIERHPQLMWLAKQVLPKKPLNWQLELKPNVVLMDIRLPGPSGIEALRIEHSRKP